MPLPAPADKRFRRAHLKPARRRGWSRPAWQRLAWLGVAGVIGLYGLSRATLAVLSPDVLTVTSISISGNARLSHGEVRSLLDGLAGQNMLTIDLETWRQKLVASPWVASASIRRVLPGAIHVLLSERDPVGLSRLGGSLYLIDGRGDVIDEYGPNYADVDLPIVDGLAVPDSPETLVDGARAALAVRLLTALQARPDLANLVSQIDVSDTRDAVVMLKGDTALVRIGDDLFVERLQSYLDLAPVLRERVPNIDYVDLRFDERVFVRPQGGKHGS